MEKDTMKKEKTFMEIFFLNLLQVKRKIREGEESEEEERYENELLQLFSEEDEVINTYIIYKCIVSQILTSFLRMFCSVGSNFVALT